MSVDQVSPKEMAEMRAWVADEFPDDGVDAYWTDEEVLDALGGHYPGGPDAFVADGRQFTDDPRYR